MTGLARAAERRRCGKRDYLSRAEAEVSAQWRACKTDDAYTVAPCWAYDGMWHVDKITQGAAPRKAVRRYTGPSPKVRALVLARDGYCCACCGISVIGRRYSLQHRDARGFGGTSDPAASLPSNLVTMAGTGTTECHGRVEHYRDPADGVKGYRLREGTDPAGVAVMYATPDGPRWYLLDDQAGKTEVDPPAEWLAYQTARSLA